MLLEKLNEVLDEVEMLKRDAEKAEAGNHSAGVRLRKDAKKVIAMLDEVRKDVLKLREEK